MSHISHPESDADANRPHVLHLVKGLGPGGAERLLVNQLQTGSGAFAYSVARLLRGKHHLVAEIEATGASCEVIGGGRFWPLGLRAAIRRRSPDIVHVHSPVIAGVVRLLRVSRQIDAIIVTTEHNRWPRHHLLTRTFNRATARLDDVRIAVSEDVRQSMDPAITSSTVAIDHGVPVDAISALANGRDQMRARLLGARAATAVVVGIVANFRPEKGYDTFLDAVDIAHRTQRSPATELVFIVVGQGPGEESFRTAVEQRGLGSVVETLGYRDDATDVMAAFDIFTLSSRHEGKPVSLMEAFALGIPAVCTRAGGIPEAIDDGENGLLVDVDDAAGLAAAWVSLAGDADRRSAMGHAASVSARSFDAAAATRSIEALYRDALGAGAGRPARRS